MHGIVYPAWFNTVPYGINGYIQLLKLRNQTIPGLKTESYDNGIALNLLLSPVCSGLE